MAGALESVREKSAVPPGLESFLPVFPALKRWATFGRPSGTGIREPGHGWILRHRLLVDIRDKIPILY
jgi:hypothetical protein